MNSIVKSISDPISQSDHSDDRSWLNDETYFQVINEIKKWPEWKQDMYRSLLTDKTEAIIL